MSRKAILLIGMIGTAVVGRVSGSELDIVINEVHYHPLSGEDRDEFIEIHNRGPTTVSLAGWRFTEGVQFVFPPTAVLEPKQFLVVCFDAALIASRHGITNVLGNVTGRLDNDGEILTLVNASGDVMSRVHYGVEGTWTSRPDGLGPSLELIDPHAVPDTSRAWAASVVVGGTPGRANSRLGSAPGAAKTLVGSQDLWRYRKGTQEASNPATAWTQKGFNDDSWAEAVGSFGYGGAGGFDTELDDMQGPAGYTTLYTRGRFTITAADLQGIQADELELSLAVRYDDAFVAYLNGTEVARENADDAGTPPPFNAVSDASRNSQALLSLSGFAGLLAAGQNVLAIHGINNALQSGDFFLEAELRLAERPAPVGDSRSAVALNEVKPSEAGSPGFIELHNSGAFTFTLTNLAIVDSAGHRFAIAGGTVVGAGARLTFSEAQVGFSLTGQETYVLVKAGTNGDEFVDGLQLRAWPGSAAGLSFGRVPDGGDDLYVMTSPTQGGANTVALESGVVINEIHYHPPFVAPDGDCVEDCSDLRQWVEIHNGGTATVNVAGWSLSKGVSITLPLAPALNIPAGGYLVFASSKSQFLADHPGFDAALVAGDWQRDLAHDSDTINLNDALGNRLDHVKYGDGNPVDDLAPTDGTDDGTFRGSEWPRGADGAGNSLELIHPRLDNRDGHAWAAGPPGGTPGAQNAAFNADPLAVIGDVEHSPAVPSPLEAVRVHCRVSAVQAITSVQALWHREDAGGNGSVTLRDDGLSGDGAAGDGVYAGDIPAQPDGAIVGFQVRAQLADGRLTTVPPAPAVPPYAGFTGPFFLYQVLAAAPPVNPSESYYVVMTAADLNELTSRPLESDALLPCTFLYLGRDGNESVRHLAGIRYRGAQTRAVDPKPYRIDFPSDHAFQDIVHLNLVSFQIEREILAADLFRRAGMPHPQEWTVNLTFQGRLDPRYVRKEHVDEDFLERFYGERSDGGNCYRALDPSGDPLAGDLSYLGEDPDSYVPYYDKRNHQEEGDYSDLIELCRAFDPAQTPDNFFADTIDGLIDANQWARYFALQTLLSNIDGSIQTSSGEDYFLYRVPADSGRPDAGKWVLVPWDVEETFQNAGEQLFRTQLVTMRRFLTHPRFAPLYYSNLVNLRNGAFNRFETRQRFPLIRFLFGFGTIDGLDTYITERIGFVDTQVPVELSAGSSSTSSGVELIAVGESWSYWKGTLSPPGGATAWRERTYIENGWQSGATGIGYGDGDDATELLDMQQIPGTQPGYSTVYCRKTFNLASPASVTNLDLVIDYDDGFVAYLNGTEVARRGLPGNEGDPVPFDALATPNHEAGQAEPINLNRFLGVLVAGDNVLAIQAVNGTLDSTDLSLIPSLVSNTTVLGGIGCGNVLYSTTDSIGLSGRANGCFTHSLTLDGAPVVYDAFRARWSATASLTPGVNSLVLRSYDGPDGTGSLLETLTITVTRLARPPTSVSGTLAAPVTTWTEAGGPYLMTDHVTIPVGSRLDIEPGTLVIGQAGASIMVRGLIQAVGTQEKPILFRALSCTNRWGGIALDRTGAGAASPTHLLRFCDLEFGDNPPGFIGCVSPVNSRLLVEDCSFRFLTANAIDGIDAHLEVRRSRFEKIAEGIHCTTSTSIVLDSIFTNMVGDKDGIDFDGDGPERSRIERCRISNGADDGIDLTAATVDLIDNVISNCADKAMSLEENGAVGFLTLRGNVIYNSGSAFSVKSGITIFDAHHNTLVGNQEGVDLFAKAGASDGGHAVFHSLIVWNNIADIRMDALSTVSFTSSNISSGVQPGAGNISAEPRFVDVAAGNFALRPGSPCIGTGQDGTDMGAIPFQGSQPTFIRADSNQSGEVSISDAIFTLTYLFQTGAAPRCLDAADANDDTSVDMSDPVFTLFFLFASGQAPPAPFPAPGVDPTADGVTCSG